MKGLSRLATVVLAAVGLVLALGFFTAIFRGYEGVAIASVAGLVALVGFVVIGPTKLRLKGGGVEVDMEAVGESQSRIAETASRLLRLSEGDTVSAEGTQAFRVRRRTEIARDDLVPLLKEAERAAVEQLITESAEWGWSMAQMGFESVPRPQVEWHDGQPRIMFGRGDSAGPSGGPLTGTERPGYDQPEDEQR